MKNTLQQGLWIALICSLLFACNSNSSQLEEFRNRQDSLSIPNTIPAQGQTENTKIEVAPKIPVVHPVWADKTIHRVLTKLNTSNSAERNTFEYISNYTLRDGKSYISVEIGTQDEDKFTVEKWLYIDTLTKKVYEHDMVQDKLVEVKE